VARSCGTESIGAGSVAEISADDGRALARHPGTAGDGLAWLPDWRSERRTQRRSN
jgi:hypothetical protein